MPAGNSGHATAPPVRKTSVTERWMITAKSRLRVELSGLAFAIKHGHTPEEYAQELWGRGAKGWMGKPDPDPLEYLQKEARAVAIFYPWIKGTPRLVAPGRAEMTICEGCLAGWAEDRWGLSRSLGLSREDVCRYCQEAFRVWGGQIGLDVTLSPQNDGTCVLRAEVKK